MSISEIHVNKMEKIVLRTIHSFYSRGCISEELQQVLHMHRYSSITARYKQLIEKDLIAVKEGDTRKASSGRQQRVMRSTLTDGELEELLS